jgi:hypothetical protein
MGHPAGYAFLYQLTGDKRYAGLAQQALEMLLAGTPDRDERYTWTSPGAGLRTGMLLTAVALAYDLAHDGWDEAFRKRVVDEIQNYKHVCVSDGGWEGGKEGLDFAHIANPYYPPGSNHYGALLGGAATALLAIKGDPGADNARLEKLLGDVEKNILKELTQGFGDHGCFAEGPGPSHMAANTSLVTALQTMKTAGGKDFISPRSNGRWLTMRWAFELVLGKDGKAYYPCRNSSTYGGEHPGRAGTSDGGEFCQGFGAVAPEDVPALLWTYKNVVEPGEAQEFKQWLPNGEKSYDALVYPQRAVLALVNWPLGVQPQNPAEVLGHSYGDSIHGYLAFRNQWKDADDIIVTAYLRSGPHGFIRFNDTSIQVCGLGLRTRIPVSTTGKLAACEPKPDGSGAFLVETAKGPLSVLVDFSGSCGAPCLVALCGPNLDTGKNRAEGEQREKGSDVSSKTTTLAVAPNSFLVLTLQKGAAPQPKVAGDKIVVGAQTLNFK